MDLSADLRIAQLRPKFIGPYSSVFLGDYLGTLVRLILDALGG